MGLGQALGWSKVLSRECLQEAQPATHAHNHTQLAPEMGMGPGIASLDSIGPEALISGT